MKGYLLPHPPILIEDIGQGRQHDAQKTLDGYQKVKTEIEAYQPDITVVITPHGPLFSDGLAIYNTQPLTGDFKAFGVPEVSAEFKNDQKLVQEIADQLEKKLYVPTVLFDEESGKNYHMSHELDHGALVPLLMSNVKSPVVVINYGLLSYTELYKVGAEIGKLLDKYQRPLIIASGDMSHKLKSEGPYSYDPAGPEFDKWLMEAFAKKDLFEIASASESKIKNAGECGMRSIQILLGAFDKKKADITIHSYEGPFGVGYGIVGLTSNGSEESLLPKLENNKEQVQKEGEENYSDPVKLAFAVVKKAVTEGELRADEDDYDSFPGVGNERKGVFVSIKNSRGLRGCIGTFLPTERSVRNEIIRNAIQSALHDPRFSPIEPRELDDLKISVDYLSEPEFIKSEDELDPVKYGVIVTKGYRRGLLLPNLEGVNTVEEQITIAKSKAGILPRETVELQRFEVVRYE